MSHRLKRARELAGLTQQQASSIDIDFVLSETEEPVDKRTLVRAAKLYDVSLCWLLGHNDQLIPAIAVKALDDSTATGKDRDVVVEVLASLSSCQACKI